MEKQSFIKTGAGQLTLIFIAIIFAFVILLIGLKYDNNSICTMGFVLILLLMLFSPVKKLVVRHNV